MKFATQIFVDASKAWMMDDGYCISSSNYYFVVRSIINYYYEYYFLLSLFFYANRVFCLRFDFD